VLWWNYTKRPRIAATLISVTAAWQESLEMFSYGSAIMATVKTFPNFFAVFPLNDAPYTAAYEEMEVHVALHHYLQVAQGVDILPSLKILLPEFIRYAVSRLPFYYPPLLPQEMIAGDIKTGEVKKDLWVPLEDKHDGWEKSGEAGQEVYGAGLPFAVVPRQYCNFKNIGIVLYCNYPFANLRFGKKGVTFHLLGHRDLTAGLKLLTSRKARITKVKVEQKTGTKYRLLNPCGQSQDYLAAANAVIRITW
jgi:hypothetical protein